mgnify:FL=1
MPWYSLLKPGAVGFLPDNLHKVFGPSIRRYGVAADGSCFFHAVQACISPEYRGMMPVRRERAGVAYRQGLAKALDVEEYVKCFGDRDMNSDELVLATEAFRELLMDSRENVGHEAWQFCMMKENVNIFIVRQLADEFVCLQDPSDSAGVYMSQSPLRTDRDTIIISNVGDVHYAAVFREDVNDVFKFAPREPECAEIRRRYPLGCRKGDVGNVAARAAGYHPYAADEAFVKRNLKGCVVPPNCATLPRPALVRLGKKCRVPGWEHDFRGKGMNRAWICERVAEVRAAYVTDKNVLQRQLVVTEDAADDLIDELGGVTQVFKTARTDIARFRSIVGGRYNDSAGGQKQCEENVQTMQGLAKDIVEVQADLDDKLQLLTEMGFSAEKARAAMRMHRGKTAERIVDEMLKGQSLDGAKERKSRSESRPSVSASHVPLPFVANLLHEEEEGKSSPSVKALKKIRDSKPMVLRTEQSRLKLQKLVIQAASVLGVGIDVIEDMFEGDEEERVKLLTDLIAD